MEAARVQPHSNAPRYERHRPEATLLYQLVERHYPAFVAALAAKGRQLPGYVQEEFAAYRKCGRLEHGFSCGCAARPATPSGWSPIAASAAAFLRAARRGA